MRFLPARRVSLLPLAAAVSTVAVVGALAVAGAAGATSTELGAPTNTAPVVSADPSARPPVTSVAGVRVGRHPGYDRVVFDFSGPATGFNVRYVPALYDDPRGTRVPLAGGAVLAVTFHSAAAHDATGAGTCPGCALVDAGMPTVEQIRLSGDVEGYVSFGLGLRQRAGFRVFRLTDPTRVVVDVADSGVTAGRLLLVGSRGGDVATWQADLDAVGRAGLAVDGIFGPLTDAATRTFQRSHGIAVDGVVGPQSREAMQDAFGG